MSAKKQLELTPTPLEDDPVAETEARYEKANRRLELTTKGGGAHRAFSHETGTVSVDTGGLEEYRKKHEEETAERAARTRQFHQRESEKLQAVMIENSPPACISERLAAIEPYVRFVLLASVFYFGSRGLFQLFCLALGRAAPEMLTFLLMATIAALVFSLSIVPPRLVKIMARFAYAAFMIAFGAVGVWHLINLLRHPPTGPRYAWFGVGHHLASIALSLGLLAGAYQLIRHGLRRRREVLEAFEAPEAPLVKRFPILENRAYLRMALYCTEGALFWAGITTLFLVLIFRADPILFAYLIYNNPAFIFFFLQPFFAFVFFRALYLPKI